MAFANAFLGVCHSMAHKLGGTHHVPHGLANALLISHVIRYNATGAPPTKCASHSWPYHSAAVEWKFVSGCRMLSSTGHGMSVELCNGVIDADMLVVRVL